MTKGRKFAYSYDNNGNQLTRSQKNGKTWTQTWDAENRLIQVSRTNGADSSIVTFKYDPFGRRIEKQIVNSFNGDTISKTVNYVYDAEDIVLQIEEVTHDSTTTTTETRFIHGPGIDEPLAFVRDGQSHFYQADGLGSIVAITDSTQAIVQKYSCESFGLPTPLTTLKQPYMFTAREWDAEIGLYFYRARYYDPMEGRFISEDPASIWGNIYNRLNEISSFQYIEAVTSPYIYTGNDPVNRLDPYGESSLSPLEKALRALAKALGYAEKADTALDAAELVGDSHAMTCAETPEERRQRQRDMVVDLINIGIGTPPFVDAVDKNKRNAVDNIVDRMNKTDEVYKELFPD